MSNNSLTYERTQLEKLIERQGELETLLTSLSTESTDADQLLLIADQQAQTKQRLKLIGEAIEKQTTKVNDLDREAAKDAALKAKKGELAALTTKSKQLEKECKKVNEALQAYVKALDALYSIKKFEHKNIVGSQWAQACDAVGASHGVRRLMSYDLRDNPNKLTYEYDEKGTFNNLLENISFEREIQDAQSAIRLLS